VVGVHLPYPGLPNPEPGRRSTPQPSPERRLPGFVEYPKPPMTDPYERLYADRVVFLGTPLTDDAANDVVAKLLDLDSDGTDLEITLQINSAGGSWTALFAVVDAMHFVGKTVRTLCMGRADGPAAVLLACGAEGRRHMHPLAQIVLRQPSLADVSTDVQTELDKVTWQRQQVERLLADRTGRPADEIRADLERPKVFSSEQALEYGLVDRIMMPRH
jgi:ATP-dependent Clp protease protease subunit